MPLCGKARRQALVATVVLCVPDRVAGVGPGFDGSESWESHAHRRHRFPERVSVPRDPTGRHRRRHVAVRRPGDRAAFRRRDRSRASASTSVSGTVCTRVLPGVDGPSEEALVRIRLLRDVRRRFRQGHESRRDLHGVHESERQCSTRCVKCRSSSRSTTAARWAGRRPSRTSSWPMSWTDRPTVVPRKARISRLARRRDFPWREVDGERAAAGGVQSW